jgi:hypothetical protein
MDFGNALTLLRGGKKLAREGWNGKGMWITLSPGHQALPPEQIWSPAIREHAEAKGSNMTFRPYLMMLTADGEMVPWVASQTDVLALDWMAV